MFPACQMLNVATFLFYTNSNEIICLKVLQKKTIEETQYLGDFSKIGRLPGSRSSLLYLFMSSSSSSPLLSSRLRSLPAFFISGGPVTGQGSVITAGVQTTWTLCVFIGVLCVCVSVHACLRARALLLSAVPSHVDLSSDTRGWECQSLSE